MRHNEQHCREVRCEYFTISQFIPTIFKGYLPNRMTQFNNSSDKICIDFETNFGFQFKQWGDIWCSITRNTFRFFYYQNQNVNETNKIWNSIKILKANCSQQGIKKKITKISMSS